MADKPKHVAAN